MNSISRPASAFVAFLCFISALCHGDQTVNGNLTVSGTMQVSGNAITFGTQGAAAGLNLLYNNTDTDTLTFYLDRTPASFLWAHTTAIAAMRLTATHELVLYKPDGSTAGLTFTPGSNTILLGSTALYRDGTTGSLRTNSSLTVDGTATVAGALSAGSVAVANGILTGASTGLTLNAGGNDQNITLTPGGSGKILLTGRVGIGVSSPMFQLSVLERTATWAGSFGAGSATPNWLNLGTLGGVPLIQGYTNSHGDVTNIGLQAFGGNVGIGTATPTTKLHVANSAGNAAVNVDRSNTAQSADVRFSTGGSATPDWYIASRDSGALVSGQAKRLDILDGTGMVYLSIPNGGNVGIGTNAPVAKLHVNGSARFGQILELPQGPAYGLVFNAYDSAAWKSRAAGYSTRIGQINPASAFDIQHSGYHSGADIAVSSWQTAVTVLASTGNVGIGTTAPSERIEVAGNAKIAGRITAGTARFDGAVRLAPQGDLSMGEFTSEAP